MALLQFLLLTFGLTYGLDLDREWVTFKEKHSKTYTSPSEERYRRSVWEAHLQFIERHNIEAAQGKHSFTVGTNRFADMPNSEFQRLMTGLRMTNRTGQDMTKLWSPSNTVGALPASVDWRNEGYVTGVKDQGQCGACWAFSATGSLEGQWFKSKGELISLSEQNLVDCSTNGNLGCEGGIMQFAFDYIRDNDGIDTQEAYPYEFKDGECRFQRQYVGATDTGYKEILAFSENDLQAAVATEGPISVAMDASRLSFQLYSSGIYYDEHCSSELLNHAVLAVGYGTENGEDYWIMKNSWSTAWGEAGYTKMARNRGNNCGIATDASFPTV